MKGGFCSHLASQATPMSDTPQSPLNFTLPGVALFSFCTLFHSCTNLRGTLISGLLSEIETMCYIPFYAHPECQLNERQDNEVYVPLSKHCGDREDKEEGGKRGIDDEQKYGVERGSRFQNRSKERGELGPLNFSFIPCVSHGGGASKASAKHLIGFPPAGRGYPSISTCTAASWKGVDGRGTSHLSTAYLTGWTTCTGFPSTQLHEMDVATIAKTAVRLAGDLCGVPGVPVLADAIVTLIETCQNIPKQKQVPSGYVFC